MMDRQKATIRLRPGIRFGLNERRGGRFTEAQRQSALLTIRKAIATRLSHDPRTGHPS